MGRSVRRILVLSSVAAAVVLPANAAWASPVLCQGQVVTVNLNSKTLGPTAGDDVILGTPGPDTIDALAGDDTVCGAGGGDTVHGRTGFDNLFGQGGDDHVYGGAQGDNAVGGPGNDHLFEGSGAGGARGGPGADVVDGGEQQDTLAGGDGNDPDLRPGWPGHAPGPGRQRRPQRRRRRRLLQPVAPTRTRRSTARPASPSPDWLRGTPQVRLRRTCRS